MDMSLPTNGTTLGFNTRPDKNNNNNIMVSSGTEYFDGTPINMTTGYPNHVGISQNIMSPTSLSNLGISQNPPMKKQP